MRSFEHDTVPGRLEDVVWAWAAAALMIRAQAAMLASRQELCADLMLAEEIEVGNIGVRSSKRLLTKRRQIDRVRRLAGGRSPVNDVQLDGVSEVCAVSIAA